MSPLFVTSCLCTIICALFATGFGSPISLDLFPGFAQNTDLNLPTKEGHVVKRRVFNDNSDVTGLKQISLQSLIGDLETSLYQSAHSVSSLAHDKEAIVAEVTPPAAADHTITKRHTEEKSNVQAGGAESEARHIEASTEPLPDARKIVLQTTEKVPERFGVPAHILIDHISVQPHTGGVPLIPAFQVHHTKVVQTTVKEQTSTDGEPTKSTQITITKTDIKATGATTEKPASIEKPDTKTQDEPISTTDVEPKTTHITIRKTDIKATGVTTEKLAEILNPTIKTSADDSSSTAKAPAVEDINNTSFATSTSTETSTPVISSSTTTASTSSSSTTTTTTTTTTAPPTHKELKEAEQELKEKVAEIEAEPVILSARV